MKKSSKILVALTGLAVLCVCAAMAAPMGMGDGDGRGMMKDGAGLQTIITKMQENGVDTTELETAIADGDQDAVLAFLEANRPADAPERPENGGQNGERMQQMITKMQENGVDTTELETAIADGNQDAVRAFLEANRPADAPEHPENGGQNGERMQQMITKMQENGVDTTELETAIADGDREAVHAFLQENRPADASEHPENGERPHPEGGNGFRHGGQQSDA